MTTILDRAGLVVSPPPGGNGPQGPQGAQGTQGVQGAQGVQGDPGGGADPAPNYSVADTITASVVGTTETAFARTITLAANVLDVGTAVEVKLGIRTVSTAVPSLTLRVRIGGVAGPILYQSSISSSPQSGTISWGLTLAIVAAGAPGPAVNIQALPVGGVSFAIANRVWNEAGVLAAATDGPLDLYVTAQWSANTAGNSATLATSYAQPVAA